MPIKIRKVVLGSKDDVLKILSDSRCYVNDARNTTDKIRVEDAEMKKAILHIIEMLKNVDYRLYLIQHFVKEHLQEQPKEQPKQTI